jgi:IMP cyclohydrolase
MNDASNRMALQAEGNFFFLRSNPNPGRGLIVGIDETGTHLVHVYWITGVSENSRNRVLSVMDDYVVAAPADPDPSLITYTAMRNTVVDASQPVIDLVGSGEQTDLVAEGLHRGYSFHEIIGECRYEHDAPHYTPRVAALSAWSTSGSEYQASIASVCKRADPSDGCRHVIEEIDDIRSGFGYCTHTYAGAGYPLPTYLGSAFPVPLRGSAEEILRTYWGALNEGSRVAIAVKMRPKSGKPIILAKNR